MRSIISNQSNLINLKINKINNIQHDFKNNKFLISAVSGKAIFHVSDLRFLFNFILNSIRIIDFFTATIIIYTAYIIITILIIIFT